MAYIYGLNLSGGAVASPQQVDNMLRTSVAACEKLYPAFQLVSWGEDTPAQAMRAAINDAYGRA